MVVPISTYNYFYMIEIIRAAYFIVPTAELTFLSLHMYLYSKTQTNITFSSETPVVVVGGD